MNRTLNINNSQGFPYRFGYQGSEKDDEISGVTGANYTTQFRELDTRIGRWWAVDPKGNAGESPYVSMGNNPIANNDVKGDTIRLFKGFGDAIALFKNIAGRMFDNKVEFFGKPMDTKDNKFTMKMRFKEGYSYDDLSKEEKKRYDYLNNLNTQSEDFNVGLIQADQDRNEKSTENFFNLNSTKKQFRGKQMDVLFKLDMLSEIDKIGYRDKPFNGGDMLLLGLTKGNLFDYNLMSQANIRSFKMSKVVLAFSDYKKVKYNVFINSSEIGRKYFDIGVKYKK